MKSTPSFRRKWLRSAGFVVLAAALAWGAATAVAVVRFDRAAWLADYTHLKHHMGEAYANLAWVTAREGFDPVALDRRTLDALGRARTGRGARRAIAAFLAEFEDGHLRIDSGPPAAVAWIADLFEGPEDGSVASRPLPPDATGEAACSALGYGNGAHDFALDARALPDWRPLPDDGAFPGGTFMLPHGRRAGLLRISHFGENEYLDACAEAWNAGTADRRDPCGTDCLDAFGRRAADALTRRAAARIEDLRSAGADVLVVDVTGNGGGSEWVETVARLVTGRPLPGTRVTFVRHAHWVQPIAEERAAIAAALARPGLSDDSRARLGAARARLTAILEELRRPCDRAPIWQGSDPGCVQTVEAPSWTTGAFDWLPPDALADLPDRASFYAPFGHDAPQGVWTGPLAVVIDGESASATEQFAASLRDHGAAVLLGQRTYGAGCGYTRGGIPAVLPNSGLVVRMPDCARLRADGSNELEGVAPDVAIPWSELDGAGRARALVEALANAARPSGE